MSEICQIAGYPPSVAGTEGRGHPLPHSPSKPCPVCTADNPRSSARAANGKMRAKFGFPMATFAAVLRAVAAEISPNLQLREMTTMEMSVRREQSLFRLIGVTVGLVMLCVITLSAAGIYALMSLAVSQRRKEIGIRAALGADPRRILASLFSRALTQLGTGAVVGMAAAALLDRATGGELMQGYEAVVLPVVAVVMMMVGLCAAFGPARRGLRIQPTEALREE